MKLLLHIFRKDVRHFSPEILVHIALLIAFAATAPFLWLPNALMDANRIVPAMLMFLIPQVWLVLISRLVHDEALVGDRQFWITRPYPWPVLLGAKLLFLAAFISVPVLITQMYLLHRGSLPIATSFPDLLRYQGLITIVFLLPFVAIAAVTASFGRHLLSVLGGLVYLAILMALRNYLMQHKMSAPGVDDVLLVMVVLFLAAAVIVMYARRPVLQTRIALLCLPAAVLALNICAPTPFVVRHAYAASTTGDAVSFDADPKNQQPGLDAEPLIFEKSNVLLQLPVQFSSGVPGREATGDGVQITLRGANGYTWRSPYESLQSSMDLQDPTLIGVFVPAAVYGKLREQPVDLELRLAVQTYAHGSAEKVTVPPSLVFDVPGHGFCDAREDPSILRCRYPLRSSPASVRTFQVQEAACGTPGPVETTKHMEHHWVSGLFPGLDPVNVESVFLAQARPGSITERHLCPGAQVVFVPEQKLQREELTLARKRVALPLYAAHKHSVHGVGQVGAAHELTPPKPLQP